MDPRKIFMLALVACLAVSCTTLPERPSPQLSIGAVLTELESASDTTVQTKGGIAINLSPVRFDTVTTTACTYEPNEGPLMFVPDDVNDETHTRLEEEQIEIMSVRPSELTLQLTIHNQMERVFRGSGAVVQFRVNQSIENVEESQYVDLVEVLIPPGSESQVEIRGPSVASLQDGSTIDLQLFDIVTAIDSAGNITKRDNFQWQFSVRRDTVRRILSTVDSRQNIWVTNSRARSILSSGIDNPSILPTRVIQPPEGTVLRTKQIRRCYNLSP